VTAAKIRLAVLLPSVLAALLAAGCVSTDTLPPYYSRAYYGPGPWGRYYYQPQHTTAVTPPGSVDEPVAPPWVQPAPGAVLLPEPPTPVPAMGMPDSGAAVRERAALENGHPHF
jgi:hypothetical protein